MEDQPVYLFIGGVLLAGAVYAYIKYNFFQVKE